ncbi:TerB family tellurite resistance protein [Planktotalea sp.]|uniref:tellurite resistance TerB family protein n=1 Tax=Planktotalea sp. TaxID=2029877 RepID=UPI00329914F7
MSIFERLGRLFAALPKGSDVKPLPDSDVPHAIGTLLVRVARSDKQYAVQEIGKIERALAKFQGISAAEAATLRAECEQLEASAPDTSGFAVLLCAGVDYDDRLSMIDALWEVAYADGTLREEETETIKATQTHLGITREDSETAQTKAQYVQDLSSLL